MNKRSIEDFNKTIDGEIIRPSDPLYDEARQVWNGLIDKHPEVIVRCSNDADVIDAVKFARSEQLPVTVRGGGHNVAGTAISDEGLVIDLSEMNSVRTNPDERKVYAEGGATIADLDASTQRHGLATPMGVVSETGIAGLTLGGGIGWLRRKYGLSSDNLIGAKVITAQGEQIHTSESEYPELFWGLRGGGVPLGVVTTFEYQLHPVGPDVMFAFVLYHGSQLQPAMRYYREYCAEAPEEVSSFAIGGTVPPEEDFPVEIHGEPYILFAACYSGLPEEGQQVLRPLREFDEPTLDMSGSMPYTEVQQVLDEEYPDGYHYYWNSLYLDHLNDEVIERMDYWTQQRPSQLTTVDIWHMGGAISAFGAEHGAVGNRESPYLLGVEANWEPDQGDDANITWAQDCIADMQQFSSGGQYLNFPGFYEDEENVRQTTFGRQYDRLKALKTQYDPGNLFWNNS